MSAHYAFDTLISEIVENGGGTYYVSAQRGGKVALTNDAHSTGFYVAVENAELQVAPSEFDKFAIADYITAHSRQLIDEDHFLGFWIADSGRVYLDLSIHVENFERALQIGLNTNQDAIWDIANGSAITL